MPERPVDVGNAAGPPLRVALVLGSSAGGVGRHVAAVARGLAARGCVVAVLGPAATNALFDFDAALPGLAIAPGFRPVEIASGARPIMAVRAALRLRRLARGADVVHAHGLRAGIVSAVGLGRWRGRARRRRPALVVTLHNAMLGSPITVRPLTAAMRLLARAANTTLVVSGDLAGILTPTPTARALVAAVPRMPARDRAATRASLSVADATPLLLAVGRLHHQKGIDVLVGALAQARGKLASAVTIIAGDGPSRAELERQVAGAGVDVRLLGDRDDVADLLRAADVVVMPSRWEGWPLAAAETLAAGRPLVATRVGGLPELVGDAALLVPPEDPGALAAALERVLGDPWLADDLRAKALRRAAGLPTDDDVTAQVFACYQRALAP